MGPAEAVKAHMDLGTPVSIAAHFQVFQLGFDGFNDAVDVLASSLMEHNLKPDAFVAPMFGQAISLPPIVDEPMSLACEEYSIGWMLVDSCPPQYGFPEKIIPLLGMLSAQTRVSPKPAIRQTQRYQ
jgi:hypothetical protein